MKKSIPLINKIIFMNYIKSQKFHLPRCIFFDDEHRNVESVSKLGVNSYLVKNGITKQLLVEATGIKL